MSNAERSIMDMNLYVVLSRDQKEDLEYLGKEFAVILTELDDGPDKHEFKPKGVMSDLVTMGFAEIYDKSQVIERFEGEDQFIRTYHIRITNLGKRKLEHDAKAGG